MSKAVDRILGHLPLVLEIYDEAEGSPSRALAIAQERAPEMFQPGILDAKTFKQYLGVLVATARATQELCILREKAQHPEAERETMLHNATQAATRIAELETEVAQLTALHSATHGTGEAATQNATQDATQNATQAAGEVPKTFCGWAVQRSPDGYVRMHRRVEGRMRSLYIGKEWSADLARAKLARAGYADAVKAGDDQG